MGRTLHSQPYYMEQHEPWWDHHQGPRGRFGAQGWQVLPIVIIKTYFKCLLKRNPTESLTD